MDKSRSDSDADRELGKVPRRARLTSRSATTNETKVMGERISPTRLLLVTMAGIFLAEIVAMIVIAQLPVMHYAVQTVLDALIMVALVYPLLYYLIFRSLLVHIAERKQAEQAIRQSEALLRKVLENLPVGVWIADRNGKLIQGNPASHQIWAGARLEGIEQYSEYKAWWLDSGEPIAPEEWAVARAISQGETSLNEEIEIESFDGTRKIILNSAVPILDEQDAIQGVIVVNQDITERKRSERLFQIALESLPVGVWISDETGKIIYGNPVGQQIWAGAGYVGIDKFDEYKGWWLNSGKRIEPEEWAVARAIQHGETSLDEEIEIECFDGSHKIILNSAIPIQDERQRIMGAFIVNQDITLRKRAEEDLRLANVYNRSLIEAGLDPLVTISIDGKITDVNSATEKVTGCTRQELIGADFSDYFTEPERARAGYQQVFLDGAVHDYALEIHHKDGHITPVLYNATVYSDEAGKVIGVFAAARDITERKRYEKELIESKELIETAFNSIDTHIAYMDREFNFIRVNDAYARAAGHPPEFFTGKYHFGLYPHEENQAIFQRVVDTGEPFSVFEKPFEYAEFPELGVTYWDWNLQPVMGLDNTVVGVVLSLVDVTERKRAELQLERQNQELRALSEAEHRQRELADGLAQSVIALASSLQLEDVLNVVLNQIRRAIPFRGAHIDLIEGRSFRVAGYRGFEGLPGSLAAMQTGYAIDEFPLYQQICATLQPVLVLDTLQDPDWRVALGMEWVRSYLAVPLVSDGQVTGIINLTSDEPGAFNQEIINRVMTFAAPASLALHNAQLYKAELTARQAAETLRVASQALTQTLELDQVLNTLLENVTAITQSDTTGIALFEGETRLAARAAQGYERWTDLDQILSLSIEANDNPALKKMISTRKSVLVSDTTTFPGWQAIPGLEAIHSWLAVPLVANEKVIGVVGLGKIEAGHFTQEHIQWAEALVGQAVMAIQNAWLFEQVRASSERLQGLSHRLVEVQENERRYIASELHDEVGQALTSLMVGLRLIEKEATSKKAKLEAAQMNQVLDSVMENLHRLAMDLRPASLDYLGLEAALQQQVEMMSEKQGLKIQFAMTGISERLPANFEIAFYRIVQEALNNVTRHARATHVDVLITQREDCLVLMIEDDGIGFSPSEAIKGKRLGLSGMRERAEMLGGNLTVESIPGKGSTILVEVPHANPNSRR